MINQQNHPCFTEQFIVILANGAFPKSEKARAYLLKAQRLVCCDGAANKAIAAGFVPDVIVGDLDSLSPEIEKQFSEKIVRISEQITNDLAKTFNYCLSKGWKDVVILGASGEREDHLLGNISLLADFATQAKTIRMVTDYGYFFPATRSGTFRAPKGSQVSIFSLNPQQEITSQGLKYPLDRLRLPRWHMGTLNEALSDEFSLVFASESPIIIYIAD